MPYLSKKYKDYHSFASSKLIDILPKDKINNAVVYEVNNFESIVLINDNNTLKRTALPIQAQVSPIKDALVEDFNKDGFKDLMLVGNHYGVEIETIRYDAGSLQIFLGDGNNNFKSISLEKSGVSLSLDSRSIKIIKKNTKKENLIFVANNNDSLKVISF
jgi:hypothetical protein